MIEPATYYGYDDQQNVIVHGTAEDASNYINPEEVQKAVENLMKVFEEQMNKIATNLTKIGEDASQAIIVQGASMDATVEDAAASIRQLPDGILGDIESLKDVAITVRNQIQQAKNDELYNAIASYSGVTQIR